MPGVCGEEMIWAKVIACWLLAAVFVWWLVWRRQPAVCGAVWGQSSRFPGSAVVCDYLVGEDGQHLCGDPMHKDSTEETWWE